MDRLDNACTRPFVRRSCVVCLAAFIVAVRVAAALPAAPPPLSADDGPANVDSTYGSGSFGTWHVDARRPAGVPLRRSTSRRPARAAAGARRAAPRRSTRSATTTSSPPRSTTATRSSGARTACRSGRTAASPTTSTTRAASAGWRVDGTVLSTLFLDRAAGRDRRARLRRRLLPEDAARRRASTSSRWSYAPFGDDPLLLDDVTITNRTRRDAERVVVRVLGREPVRPDRRRHARRRRAGLGSGDDDALGRRSPAGAPADTAPLDVFAAVLAGPARRLRDVGRDVLRRRLARGAGGGAWRIT